MAWDGRRQVAQTADGCGMHALWGKRRGGRGGADGVTVRNKGEVAHGKHSEILIYAPPLAMGRRGEAKGGGGDERSTAPRSEDGVETRRRPGTAGDAHVFEHEDYQGRFIRV